MVVDPLGLERCSMCGNAFAYDADDEWTRRLRESGESGFICRWCAERLDAEEQMQ